MRRACIFCASSPKVPQVYFSAATRLAELLTSAGWGVVYGGGGVGLMGAVADAVLARGGAITGVIPKFMVDVEWQHDGVEDMRQTATMAERKRMMIEMSDAIVALPGSTGTMDEFFEAMADEKLGLYTKPLVLLNTDGFFDHTVAQMERMVREEFMTRRHMDVLTVARTPEEAMAALEAPQRETPALADAAVK